MRTSMLFQRSPLRPGWRSPSQPGRLARILSDPPGFPEKPGGSPLARLRPRSAGVTGRGAAPGLPFLRQDVREVQAVRAPEEPPELPYRPEVEHVDRVGGPVAHALGDLGRPQAAE